MDKELVMALVRILVLLPLICLLAYLSIRYGLGRNRNLALYGAGKRMRVIEQVSLGPKSGLSLVQVGNNYLLFAHQDSCIVLVKEMDQLPKEIETPSRQDIQGLSSLYKNIFTRAGRHNTCKRNEH